jgi:hypothetical protein
MNSQKHPSGNGHRPTFNLLTQPLADAARLKPNPVARDHDISSHAKKHHTVQYKTKGACHEHLLVIKTQLLRTLPVTAYKHVIQPMRCVSCERNILHSE